MEVGGAPAQALDTADLPGCRQMAPGYLRDTAYQERLVGAEGSDLMFSSTGQPRGPYMGCRGRGRG